MEIIVVILVLLILGTFSIAAFYFIRRKGNEDQFFTHYPLQGFAKFVERGKVVQDLVLSNDGVYEPKTDTLLFNNHSIENKPSGLFYWIDGLKWIGPTSTIAEFPFDRQIVVYKKRTVDGEEKTNVEVEEYSVMTKELPLEFDAAIQADDMETKGTLYVFFKISVRFQVMHPLKFYSLIHSQTSGLKKALGAVRAYLKVYAQSRTLEEITMEDTAGSSVFLETLMKVNEDSTLPTSTQEIINNIIDLTGLKMKSAELIDFGPVEDKKHEEIITALRAEELADLNGRALLKTADYNYQAEQKNKETELLKNDVEKDLQKKIGKIAYVAKKKWEGLKQVNVYAEGGSGITTPLPLPDRSRTPAPPPAAPATP